MRTITGRLCALILLLPACSTNDPGAVSRAEVEGIYSISQLVFEPSASAVQPADVGVRFDSGFTTIELLGSGDVLLRYRFEGGSSVLISGNYNMTRNGVRIEFAHADRSRQDAILLPSVIRMHLGAENLLTADVAMTANLDAYDRSRYQGLTSVSGVLRVRFERQIVTH
ncbi:hypothetical protein BH23ACT11_BH23ACT11_15370 [soil metagenome]